MPLRRKVCYFCQNKIEHVSYRDTNLRNFVSDKGRIVPAKISGVCHRHQRRLSSAIKQARTLSLLPYLAR
jgi:small subunit ribosomal protein S18